MIAETYALISNWNEIMLVRVPALRRRAIELLTLLAACRLVWCIWIRIGSC